MARLPTSTVAFFLLLPVFLSACLEPESSDAFPGDVSKARPRYAFEAAYANKAGDVEMRLAFGNVSSASDEDGTLRHAYVLDAFTNISFSMLNRRFLLDGDFRVVRGDWPCIWDIGGSSCSLVDVRWVERYQLAPYGLGFPLAFADGVAEQQAGFAWRNATGRVREIRGGFEVEFEASDLKGMAASGLSGSPLVYTDGRALPDRIVLHNRKNLELVEYHEGPPLPAIEPWPPRTVPAARDIGPWTYFPGDGDDPFEVGITHREAVDALRAHSSQLDAWLQGEGCLLIYGSTRPVEWSTDPLSLVTTTVATFDVVARPKEGQAMYWRFRHEQSPLESKYTFEEPESINIEKPCREVETALPGNVTAGEFLSRLQDPSLAVRVKGFAFVCDSESGSVASDLAPCHFHADLEKQQQTFGLNHIITLSSRTGWWNSLHAPPEVVERFDR
ncbi:MAG TPA: hypothetical protein VI796_02730 [Candidatus Thermoplasmatota archaeon]|nr:hypothetical protein [Candidatus Thermoplasmatota archaeon]